MAASSSSSDGRRCKYDVFLSFRGEDTRKTFVCHLYRALEQKSLHTFFDCEKLEKGHKISELMDAIEESSLSIVVLSQNFASSTWCLKELVQILDCMENKNHLLLPVFYQVDPSDLRNIRGTFEEAFTKHEKNSKLHKEELESWRAAVIRVADLSGWDSTKYEDDGKLIEKIVEITFQKLIHTWSNKANDNDLVGMDSHIAEVYSRLGLQVNDVRVVGIWGMGGLGKTTIARAVFDKIAYLFDHSCFIYVKEAFKNKHEVQMREVFISILLKEKVQTLGLIRGWSMMKEKLGMKKVLVVLDDVETFSQIEGLLGNLHSFGEGSRVIVTTRNKQSLSGVSETYKPTYLSGDESLELFKKYAFRTNQPKRDYDYLSRRAVEYAQGLPLALKVLGACLDNRSVYEWEVVLDKLKKIPEIEIQDVLRTSYDGLNEFEKDIFLDIACFFRKWNKDFVTEFLYSCGFFPHNGLRVLVDRALITDRDLEFDMHDLLQDMGREIVRLECTKEPQKRSRLWSYEDVYRILTQNTAMEAIECLVLDLSNSNADLCINPGAFVRMTRLRLLIIYYSFITIFDDKDYRDYKDIFPVDGCKQLFRGDFEFLSQELRLLLWHGCPLKSLPSTFIPEKLVQLDMRGSHIQQLWEGIKPLQSLKVIMLSYCQYLVKIPDLTEAINLEKLCLDGCSRLFEVHSSISALQNLDFLNLGGCKELEIFPSSIHMKSLKVLCLSGCSNLEKFPEISQVMHELTNLDLYGTAIKELPSSINNLTSLVTLDLQGCGELESLPSIIHMKSLESLILSGCSNVKKCPEISEVMTGLKRLHLDGTAIKELPSSITNLIGLHVLDLSDCTQLVTLPTDVHMSSLRTLNLQGCSNLETFPEISGIMTKLSELRLDGTAIKGLPSSINLLVGLKQLTMRDCKSLVSLPDSICNMANLKLLHLSGCSALHNLPEKLGDLDSLEDLDIDDSGIKQLPVSIIRVHSVLSCIGCKEMTAPLSAWPSSMEYSSRLFHVDLSDCNLLELSDGIAHLSSLETLKLCRNNLESLPVTMNHLGWLTHLELEACKRLKSIPELSSRIKCIDAHDCTALETVSTPKTRNCDFRFSNCFRLVHANLFRYIVETHYLDQDNHLRPPCFNMCLPGSEVPEWFNLRDTGCSVTFNVPPNSLNNNLLGFAVCIVINFSGAPHDVSNISNIYGRCKGIHDEHFVQLDLVGLQYRTCRFLESDHLFMGYMSWSEYDWISKDRLDAFTIVVETGSYSQTDDCLTSSCGVRLVYANHEEMQNSVTQRREEEVDDQKMEDAVQQGEGCCAKGRVSGLGEPSFPDQLEIRNNDSGGRQSHRRSREESWPEESC